MEEKYLAVFGLLTRFFIDNGFMGVAEPILQQLAKSVVDTHENWQAMDASKVSAEQSVEPPPA